MTLTGSEAAGSSVAAVGRQHVKKTVLELGGSDPFIVMESADIDAAARTAVTARTINNGQSCIAAKRFIVAQRIVEDFTTRFVERMRSARRRRSDGRAHQRRPAGDGQDPRRPARAGRRVAAEDGASLLVGGAPRAGKGFYYEPTVMRDDTRDSAGISRGDLRSARGDHRASATRATRSPSANDSRFGLGAAAWTRDEKEIERFARELEAGSVFINGMVASDARFPFGGVKKSGYGRELSALRHATSS